MMGMPRMATLAAAAASALLLGGAGVGEVGATTSRITNLVSFDVYKGACYKGALSAFPVAASQECVTPFYVLNPTSLVQTGYKFDTATSVYYTYNSSTCDASTQIGGTNPLTACDNGPNGASTTWAEGFSNRAFSQSKILTIKVTTSTCKNPNAGTTVAKYYVQLNTCTGLPFDKTGSDYPFSILATYAGNVLTVKTYSKPGCADADVNPTLVTVTMPAFSNSGSSICVAGSSTPGNSTVSYYTILAPSAASLTRSFAAALALMLGLVASLI